MVAKGVVLIVGAVMMILGLAAHMKGYSFPALWIVGAFLALGGGLSMLSTDQKRPDQGDRT